MNFNLSTMAQSLATYLAPSFPGVAFYQDPNQQGTQAPCMFLQQRFSTTKKILGRWEQEIGLDLTFLESYNLPNLQELYQNTAGILDPIMETFPYTDGTTEGTTLLRTYEREWRIDPDALHYTFTIKVLVSVPEDFNPMQTIEQYNEAVTE